jgi:DNA-binding HxlR family transcriptional regulator
MGRPAVKVNQPANGGAPGSRPEHEPCNAALSRAFGFFGKRWTGVIVATLLEGPAGFSELRRTVGGISDSVLSERLAELGGAGLVSRTVSLGPPLAVTYELTEAGQGLLPAMRELTAWASANLPPGGCNEPADSAEPGSRRGR